MDKKTLTSKTVKELRALCLARSIKPDVLKDDIVTQLVKYEQKQKRLAKKAVIQDNGIKNVIDTPKTQLSTENTGSSRKTRPAEKASRPVEKASRPVEKASRPVEKASRPVEKASRPVEKAGKTNKQEIGASIKSDIKKTTDGKYTILKQLGKTGKEGTTFLVVDKKGCEYAMKVFPKQKSINTLLKEVEHQREAARHGIAPEIKEINQEGKYIVMEKLDKNLFDIVKKNNGEIPDTIQRKIANVIKQMDETGVFHGDPNPANFMMKGTSMYMIDYGFARDIDDKLMKKYETKTPNKKFMILGLILKLKEIYRDHNPNIEYKVLSKILSV
jgi:serine/threonine protein kinase